MKIVPQKINTLAQTVEKKKKVNENKILNIIVIAT